MMKKLIAVVFAALLVSPALAQEAPDVLVKRAVSYTHLTLPTSDLV